MGSEDIEVVVMQDKASKLKHISTDIIENTLTKQNIQQTTIQCVLVSNLSTVALIS